MQRYDVHFTGRVQGVGFRAICCDLAKDFEVAGYVSNLPDGRVRLVAEGDKSELEGLLDAIRRRMSRYIRDVAIDRGPAEGLGQPEPGGLRVRY